MRKRDRGKLTHYGNLAARLERDGRSGVLGLSRRSAEGREGRRGIQARREIADKGFHRRVPEAVEAEEIHFFQGLIGRPLLHGHAIDGGEHAGAIVTEAAVNEDLLPRMVAKKREKLDNLFIGWRRPAADGNVDKAHAQRFGVPALPKYLFAVFPAQIDNGGDAQYFELRETDFLGLCAPVKEIRNFTGVGNSGDVKFLPKGGPREWRSRDRPGGLRKELKREKKKESERGESAFHIE